MNFAQTKISRASKSFEYEYIGPAGTKVKELVTISFPDGSLTAEVMDAITQFEQDQKVKPLAYQLSQIDLEWDLTWKEEDEDERHFPPSYENLSGVVDVNFLLALTSAMTETLSGNVSKPSKSRSSLAGSAKSRTKTANV
jgi:hypothetical protein